MGFIDNMKGYFNRDKDPEYETYSPLRIRLDSLITLDMTPFLIHDEYLVMENPGTCFTVTNVGAIDVDPDLDIFRIYINSENGQSILQVAVEAEEIVDLMLFREIGEVIPETADHWTEWLGDPYEDIPGYLNGSTFDIQDGAVVYQKEWIELMECSEDVYVSESLNHSERTIQHQMMLFSRDLSEEDQDEVLEYLMLSVEDEERINMYVGIELSPAGITVM